MNYFEQKISIADIKAHYRKLALQYHPDRNPGTDTNEIMKEINNQYHARLKQANGQTITDDQGIRHEYKYNYDVEQALVEKIRELLALRMEGVEIELIGVWIWVSGNTKPYKDELKKAGCFWHVKRLCWYFHTGKFYYKRYSENSFDELRYKYGYTDVKDFEQNSMVKVA